MSVEVNLVGTRCGAKAGGLSCAYCYQGAVRRATNNAAPAEVDHAAIEKAIVASCGTSFSLFGGEPLLAERADLERVWRFGYEKFGKNGVQTSGRPIDDDFLRLFRQYKVHVGFSIDGPGALNDARRAGTQAETRSATDHSIAMLLRCLADGIGTSLIVTLSKMNASPENLPVLLAWFEELDAAGLKTARLHILERDGAGAKLALSDEDNIAAFLAAHALEAKMTLRFDVFGDMRRKLLDLDGTASCTWNHCDPWTTPAVHGISADGSRTLCQRVHKDGREWTPLGGARSSMRAEVLWATSQEDGGCSGCKYFAVCGGHCPGTAIDGDWRNRTVDCATWYALLERTETDLRAEGKTIANLDVVASRISGGDMYADHTDKSGWEKVE